MFGSQIIQYRFDELIDLTLIFWNFTLQRKLSNFNCTDAYINKIFKSTPNPIEL